LSIQWYDAEGCIESTPIDIIQHLPSWSFSWTLYSGPNDCVDTVVRRQIWMVLARSTRTLEPGCISSYLDEGRTERTSLSSPVLHSPPSRIWMPRPVSITRLLTMRSISLRWLGQKYVVTMSLIFFGLRWIGLRNTFPSSIKKPLRDTCLTSFSSRRSKAHRQQLFVGYLGFLRRIPGFSSGRHRKNSLDLRHFWTLWNFGKCFGKSFAVCRTLRSAYFFLLILMIRSLPIMAHWHYSWGHQSE